MNESDYEDDGKSDVLKFDLRKVVQDVNFYHVTKLTISRRFPYLLF